MFRVCVVLIAIVCAVAGLTAGKAFFCRDPDTGKLHPANTTWRSTTFCGNYHCRLRRKNLTKTEYPPIRQINVTNVGIQNEIPKIATYYSQIDKKFDLKKGAIDITGINNLLKFDISNLTRDESEPKASEDDRYLTEKEIETISAILHTVKKSDLDAIIEIYNLAQDIYKEVDQTSPENILHETINDIKNDLIGVKTSKLRKPDDVAKVSYWYEPIASVKLRHVSNGSPDTMTLPSNVVKVTTPKPTTSPTTTTESPSRALPSNMINSFFDKTLTSKDFGKLPYYYPISNFQRISSYVHQPEHKKTHSHPANTAEVRKKVKSKPAKYRLNDIKPSIYLPYPFSFIPRYYNWSYPHTIFYNKNFVEREKIHTPIINAVLVNPDLENHQDLFKAVDVHVEKANDESKSIILVPEEISEQNIKHEWQTAPIAKDILEDARAHIEKTKFLKPFSLRKKIKLERVGKVFKLDELTQRSKREANELEPELYEVYIERQTCKADYTVPGFFRYGNSSQPFPECCPQRIL